MSEAHHRKKDPSRVRHALIERAVHLAAKEGLASLSVQAVASAAGVTKGGVFHHFANKQLLINAAFEELLNEFDCEIDGLIAADMEPHGSFTRAYVKSIFSHEQDSKGGSRASLAISMLTDANLRSRWSDWVERRMDHHRLTDSDLILETVRMAADGVWLADLSGVELPNRNLLHDFLIQLTCNKA